MRISEQAKRKAGMTLVELLVALGVSVIVLLAISMVFINSSVSFAAMGNYISLDRSSRSAIDQMSRDIRKCQDIVSFATNQMVFQYSGTTNLTYIFDPTSKTLRSWKTGGTTNTLLSGCSSLTFSMFMNTPGPSGTFTNTTSVASGKAVSVTWKCSQSILGRRTSSEDMETAMIVVRNKQVP